MADFKYEIRDGIAWVTFDSGAMNTLSRSAIREVADLRAKLAEENRKSRLDGVVLKGNRFGLGAGANIGELMNARRSDLEELIDAGHKALFAIEECEFPWLAVVDGYALGGIYELALACRGIVATAKSTLGFPEIRLNIFPGLGGTQRMPRLIGVRAEKLVHAAGAMFERVGTEPKELTFYAGTTGAGTVTAAPQTPKSAGWLIAPGQVRVGFIASSTVTTALHVASLPWPSLTVRRTVTGLPTFEQLTPDFIHASDQQGRFRLLFWGGKIGFEQTVLNLKCFAPPLHTDIEIPLPNERRQVIRFNLENFLERLKRFFVTFGFFQILA